MFLSIYISAYIRGYLHIYTHAHRRWPIFFIYTQTPTLLSTWMMEAINRCSQDNHVLRQYHLTPYTINAVSMLIPTQPSNIYLYALVSYTLRFAYLCTITVPPKNWHSPAYTQVESGVPLSSRPLLVTHLAFIKNVT